MDDDLPTNEEYLDDSFGGPVDLREASEADLLEFDDTDSVVEDESTPTLRRGFMVEHPVMEKFTLLDQDGINMVEDYFETLPPEDEVPPTE